MKSHLIEAVRGRKAVAVTGKSSRPICNSDYIELELGRMIDGSANFERDERNIPKQIRLSDGSCLGLSIAHARSIWIATISRDSVGCDVELDAFCETLPAWVHDFLPDARSSGRAWTLLESIAKARDIGLWRLRSLVRNGDIRVAHYPDSVVVLENGTQQLFGLAHPVVGSGYTATVLVPHGLAGVTHIHTEGGAIQSIANHPFGAWRT